MNPPYVAPPRSRVRSRVDHAFVALLRSVLAEDWCPEKGARELLENVGGDRRVLALMRAKLSRATLDRPTGVTARADRTLEAALAATAEQVAASLVIPRQGGRDA